MKKKTYIKIEGLGSFAKCPFCGYTVEVTNPIKYCSGCYIEYDVKDKNVIFDNEKKSDKYIWAKAFAKSGGIRIGKNWIEQWEPWIELRRLGGKRND